MIVAVLSVVFSVLFIWYSRYTDHSFFVVPSGRIAARHRWRAAAAGR